MHHQRDIVLVMRDQGARVENCYLLLALQHTPVGLAVHWLMWPGPAPACPKSLDIKAMVRMHSVHHAYLITGSSSMPITTTDDVAVYTCLSPKLTQPATCRGLLTKLGPALEAKRTESPTPQHAQ
jgi:hypothetical protein